MSGRAEPLDGGRLSDEELRDLFSLAIREKNKLLDLPTPQSPIADAHAHLMSFWGTDPVRALARAAAAGAGRIVTLWDPIGDAEQAADLATYQGLLSAWLEDASALFERGRACGAVDEGRAAPQLFDNVRYLVGVHPYGTMDYTPAVHEAIFRAQDDPRCAGVGEIGVDYHFDAADDIAAAPHEEQQMVMARQLMLANSCNVPVELHLRHEADDEERSSHVDAYDVLVDVGVPRAGCVLHCFGEDRATMERFCDLGCFFAFGGAATFKRNGEVREAFAACPLDRILFETDCPYMAPEPLRGLECEPAMICQTVDVLCRDRAARTGEDPRDIALAAWDNAERLFG